jgi:serine/threonine protein kinase
VVIDSVDALLTALRRVHVFAPEQTGEIERELLPHFNDPRELADHLVRIEWLTPFQYELLFTGEGELLAVGPYTLLDRLGTGGVSEVYKAWDTLRGRVVAVKVLHRHPAGRKSAPPPIRRELQALPRLGHPNVIRILEAEQGATADYLAMEYVEGVDLARYVQQVGPLSVEGACEYVRQATMGLQHAHQFGLVHRDVKPANLFLVNPPQPGSAARRGSEPLVKIVDWGLARIRPADEGSDRPTPSLLETEKAILAGTADYVPPEQARDAGLVDTRCDIYGLGCTFVYLLTGQPPFPARTLLQKLTQHRQAPPPPLRGVRPEIPEELEQLIHKMMAKDPADRPRLPLLVASQLRRFLSGALPGGDRPAFAGVKPRTAPGGNRPGTAPAVPSPAGGNGVHPA